MGVTEQIRMAKKSSIILDLEKGEATAYFGDTHQRTVLIASEAFIKMMEALNAFGSAGLTIFYMMGQEKGRFDVLKEIEALHQQNIFFTKRQVLENIMHQLKVTGWGAPRIQKFDEERGILTILVVNNPLAGSLTLSAKPERPICHYFRGYWVGVVSEVLERKMSCIETRCMGAGEEYCEFKITPT